MAEKNNANIGFEKQIWMLPVCYGGTFLQLNIER